MSPDGAISELVAASDPANVALLAVVWWRLDRRLRALRRQVAALSDAEG